MEEELLNIPIFIINDKYVGMKKYVNKTVFIFKNLKDFFYNFNNIMITIAKFSKVDKKLLYIIYKYLLKFGYCFLHLGTKYLAYSIFLIFFQKRSEFKLEKEIYPIIAKKYNTSIHNVECDITLATKYMNNFLNSEKITIVKKYCIDGNINTNFVINYILKELNKSYY